MLLEGRGKSEEAEALYLRLLEVQRRALGPDHRQTLGTAMQLAGAQLARGDHAAVGLLGRI